MLGGKQTGKLTREGLNNQITTMKKITIR